LGRRTTAAVAANPGRRRAMSNHTYKVIELVGSSTSGIEDAIRNAVAEAGKTLRNLRWFEVIETRGHIEKGEVVHYQVHLKVGFTIDGQT
jgi:dodecin